MKIGSGGHNAQAAQDAVAARQQEQIRLKPTLEQELLQSQKQGLELNKPVLHPNKSAELEGYLRNKETSGEGKKNKDSGGKRQEGDKPKDSDSPDKDMPPGLKGVLLDKYM
ncbi:hypothetical protein DCCM_0477 [Desulfocucumis palustris]|uniref:Uncharacterized protein n=1 Tax=Desulfocucumis palustris TaxID=1898651 RepID=A0A2L2X9K2_9FIRM|nr:hypothetical protein [Desulfocucumis palustris]GBF32283.1 hypothetical protein DCCM_0477 [Desulfocucumis palustris]